MDLNPQIVCAIIGSAREFQAKEAVVFPEQPNAPDDDWAMQVLADHAGDLSFREAKSLIDDLEPDQQVSLVALMWVGRGDFELDEWEDAFDQARDVEQNTAEYLLSTPMLPDYLEEALAQMGYDCEE